MGRKLRITTPRQQNRWQHGVFSRGRVRALLVCPAWSEGGNKQTALFDPCILGHSRHQSKKRSKEPFLFFLKNIKGTLSYSTP